MRLRRFIFSLALLFVSANLFAQTPLSPFTTPPAGASVSKTGEYASEEVVINVTKASSGCYAYGIQYGDSKNGFDVRNTPCTPNSTYVVANRWTYSSGAGTNTIVFTMNSYTGGCLSPAITPKLTIKITSPTSGMAAQWQVNTTNKYAYVDAKTSNLKLSVKLTNSSGTYINSIDMHNCSDSYIYCSNLTFGWFSIASNTSAPSLVSPANNSVTTSQNMSLSWSGTLGDHPSKYEYKLNNGNWINANANTSASVSLSVGANTWQVRKYDYCTNQYYTSGTYTVYYAPINHCGDVDHGGNDWTISSNITVAGRHYNVGKFTVNSGITATVNGTCRYFTLEAEEIDIKGTINANGKGDKGGAGGAGGKHGYNGSDYYCWGGYGGEGGKAGVGQGGGGAGGDGGQGECNDQYCGGLFCAGNEDGHNGGGGSGGGGAGGTYGGAGGTGGIGAFGCGYTAEDVSGGAYGGTGASKSVYGTATGEDITWGSGGGGAGGGGGSWSDGSSGGSGGSGGGMISLISSGKLTLSGNLYCNGTDGQNGGKGGGESADGSYDCTAQKYNECSLCPQGSFDFSGAGGAGGAGGSGGGILIQSCGETNISGIIEAKGGKGGVAGIPQPANGSCFDYSSGGAGGGGGRVKIFRNPCEPFSMSANVSVAGGTGGAHSDGYTGYSGNTGTSQTELNHPNYQALKGGTVGSNQSICYDTKPNAFTNATSASGGGCGAPSYQWMKCTSSCSNPPSNFTNISGATSATYNPNTNHTQTTSYVRKVTNGSCTAYSNVVTVTVYPQFAAGTISSAQTICYNTAPSQLTGTAPTGGNTPYTYQWQSSTNGSTFTNISGATSINYSPPALTQDTWYRRVDKSSSGCGQLNTNTIKITVRPQFVAGTISSAQTICFNTAPNQLTGTAPTGGNTPYTYQWQSSTNGSTFTNISGATSINYSPPALTQDTWYRRVDKSSSGCGELNTNTIKITVRPQFVAGTISSAQTICYNTAPSQLTGTAPTGGNTPYTYQWQSFTNGSTFTNISGATSINYSPPALTQDTWYRRVDKSSSGCGELNTNVIKITVYPKFVAGTVSSGTETICEGDNPTTIANLVSASGGKAPITYEWRANGVAIPASNSATYTPSGNVPGTVEYTRWAKDSECNTTWTQSSGTWTLTIDPAPQAGTISATPNTIICAGKEVELTLNGSTGTIQWQTNASGTWQNIPTATTTQYTTPNLVQNTTYRVMVSSGVCAAVYSAEHTVTVELPSIPTISGNDYVWTGAIDANWNEITNKNWLIFDNNQYSIPTTPPTANSNVFIKATTNCFTTNPNVSTVNQAHCKNLTIESGNTLVLLSNGELTIKGNLENNGNLAATSGKLIFNGSGNTQSIKTNNASFGDVIFNNNGGKFVVKDAVKVEGTATFTQGIVELENLATFTFGNNATSNEGTATSFVDGVVTKQGSSNFTFPVGDGSVWAPVSIAAPSPASNISAKYIFSQPPYNNWNQAYMCDPSELHHVSGIEYWELSTSSARPAVTLYWKDAGRSEIGSLADLRVAHWTGSCWKNKGGSGIDDGSNTGHITSNLGFSSYSPITFGTFKDTNPLPVELLRFDVSCKAQDRIVSWSTATEINNDYFNIERSFNGISYDIIGQESGAGTTNIVSNYSFIDDSNHSGDIYYRITQVDFDGSAKTYDAQIVNCDGSSQIIVVRPNPFQDMVEVSAHFDDQVRIDIYNSQAKLVYSELDNIENTKQLHLQDLKPGVYLLKITEQNGKTYNFKIVKR